MLALSASRFRNGAEVLNLGRRPVLVAPASRKSQITIPVTRPTRELGTSKFDAHGELDHD